MERLYFKISVTGLSTCNTEKAGDYEHESEHIKPSILLPIFLFIQSCYDDDDDD
jgi:hypothetical protein